MTLDEIEKMCEMATSGPWESWDNCDEKFAQGQYRKGLFEGKIVFGRGGPSGQVEVCTLEYASMRRDAEFIAASRTLVPKLLAIAMNAKALAALDCSESPEAMRYLRHKTHERNALLEELEKG